MAQANSVQQSDRAHEHGHPGSRGRTREQPTQSQTSHADPEGAAVDEANQGADEEMVMTSIRLTRAQVRSLDIVSQLTGRKKAEIVREALEAEFERLSSPEEAEAMAEIHRQRVLKQTEQLRRMLPTLASSAR